MAKLIKTELAELPS
jgi:hypothetical protein